jgi:UDP-glucose 4-epimerase
VLLDAVERSVSHPQPVNLAFGARAELQTVVSELEQIIGRPIARRHVAPRPGDVRHSEADNRVLRSLFPQVVPTPRIDGLRATVEWFEAHVMKQPA